MFDEDGRKVLTRPYYHVHADAVEIASVAGKNVEDLFDGGYDVPIKPSDIITKGPWVDVRAYGAVGDGTTDDTTAVQNAINSITDVEQSLLISDGEFLVTGALTLQTGLKIKGTGTLKFSVGATAYIFDCTNLSNIIIDGIKITVTADAAVDANQGLFLLNTSNGITIKNCDIVSTNRTVLRITGLGATASTDIYIRDNKIKATGANVFTVYTSQRTDTLTITTAGNKNIVFKGNLFYDGANCLLLDGDMISVDGNTFDAFTVPIACLKLRDSIFSNNKLFGFVGNAIVLGNGTDDMIQNVTVSDNIIDGTGTSTLHGINVYKQGGAATNRGLSKWITITGNTIRDCAESGIFAYANGYLTIGNNVVADCGIGIQVNSGEITDPGTNIITGNLLTGNAVGLGLGASGITSGVPFIIAKNNIIRDSTGNGAYLARLSSALFNDNIIDGSGGDGLYINVCAEVIAKGNRVTGTTGASFRFGTIGASDACVIEDNDFEDFTFTTTRPFVFRNNKGVAENAQLLAKRAFYAQDTNQDVVLNVPLPTTSNWRSGQILVHVAASRETSSDLANAHQSCIAVINLLRYLTTITIRLVTYLYQNDTLPRATITIAAGADNNSIDITANSNYASTSLITITATPLTSPLFTTVM